jgi:hypothetical protein
MTLDLKISSQLLGAYFHQDWADEFANDANALQLIISSETSNTLRAVADEIAKLLALGLDEIELARIVNETIGCFVDPASKGQTCAEWLSETLTFLREHS